MSTYSAGAAPVQEDILKLAYEVSRVTEEKVDLIDSVTRQTNLLAINARIEAARAGASGAAFSVVAQEMGVVAGDINRISRDLRAAISANIQKLEQAGQDMMAHFRGARFTALAHNAVEIIDRNLYERSCDVRWWATDSAIWECARDPTVDACAYATRRLGQILDSYTGYFDLVLADLKGRIIANGRPQLFQSVGENVSGAPWFRAALA